MIRIKVGDKLKIISMFCEAQYNGKIGTVTKIDPTGLVFGTWGNCAIIPEIDYFEFID